MRLRYPLALALCLCLALPAAALASPQQLTVQKVGTGTALITSSPTGIECGSTCQAPFPEGATVAVKAIPGPNTEAIRWSGCDSLGAEGQCLVTMTSARTITATAEPLHLPLTVSRAGPGAPNSSVAAPSVGIECGTACRASVAFGAVVTLTASPGPNQKPASWTGCAPVSGHPDECKVTMSAAENVTATFEALPGFEVLALTVAKSGNGDGTVTGSPGSISCGALCSTELVAGATVTLDAAPSPGSVFAHWTGGGCTGAGPCTTTLSKAKTVTAVFELSGARTLSVQRSGAGQGTVSARSVGIECGSACSAQVKAGTAVTLTAKAAKGSSFAHWSGACQSTAKTCKVTMSEARQVTAVFSGPPPSPSSGGGAAAACVVPKLAGKSLKGAKRALRAAHCPLGKVTKPKRKGSSRLVVRSSTPAAGTSLASGAKVDLRLGRARRPTRAS